MVRLKALTFAGISALALLACVSRNVNAPSAAPSAAPATLTPYFSPHGACRAELEVQIDSARRSLDIAIYDFTVREIATHLLSAMRRGVRVRLLMDSIESTSSYSQWYYLHSQFVNVRRNTRQHMSGIMHDKYLIRDTCTVITGSYNWSGAAESSNAENELVINSHALALQYESDFDAEWQIGR